MGITRQQSVDFQVVIIDNASADSTVEWIRQNYNVVSSPTRNPLYNDINQNKGPLPNVEATGDVVLIQNQTNQGFAAGHNQGFAICEAPYVLVLNPDTELQAGYLEEVVRIMESAAPLTLTLSQRERGLPDGRIAAVQGKLYRELPKQGNSGIIDSCGLQMKPYGQVVDIGQNSVEKAEFGLGEAHRTPHPSPLPEGEGVVEIWGATGACAFYRLEALKQVADKHGIFDERFGSYKEDVDLAWRLKLAGWKAVFTPGAIAWHGRRVGKGDRRTWKIRYLSFRNHILMVGKNLRKLVVRN